MTGIIVKKLLWSVEEIFISERIYDTTDPKPRFGPSFIVDGLPISDKYIEHALNILRMK
jgi:hypothetical protein